MHDSTRRREFTRTTLVSDKSRLGSVFKAEVIRLINFRGEVDRCKIPKRPGEGPRAVRRPIVAEGWTGQRVRGLHRARETWFSELMIKFLS